MYRRLFLHLHTGAWTVLFGKARLSDDYSLAIALMNLLILLSHVAWAERCGFRKEKLIIVANNNNVVDIHRQATRP